MRTYFTLAYDLLLKHRQELWKISEIGGTEEPDIRRRIVAKQKDEWDELQKNWEEIIKIGKWGE